jgi:purine-binding chemotaxis protein CheW
MTTETIDGAQCGTQRALAGKYLTFSLGQEEYGVPVLRVREIVKVLDITPVPQMPGFVRGVINLRGKVIPILDLRARFGFAQRDHDDRTCIIVVDRIRAGAAQMFGMVVDAVSEVRSVKATDMEGPPSFGTHVALDFVGGLAKSKERVAILLDLDSVLGANIQSV